MKKARHSDWILAAVLSALPAVMLPMSAHGQAQINADGHARDANPRFGSGGLNGQGGPLNGQTVQPGVVGNQMINSGNNIMYNNVSGLSGFRGKEPILTPGAFHGTLAGVQTDQFSQRSTPAPLPNQPNPTPNVSTVSFRPSLGIAPPSGFAPTFNAGGFVPTRSLAPRPLNDARLGIPPDVPVNALPTMGQLVLPGQVDPTSNAPSVLVSSPLYGIKQLGNDAADQAFLQRYGQQGDSSMDHLQLDARTIERMRAELRGIPGGVPQANPQNKQDDLNGGGQQSPGQGQPLNGQISGKALQSSVTPLSGQPLSGSIGLNAGGASGQGTGAGTIGQPLGAVNNLSTNQLVENRPLDATAAKQSGQYSKMRTNLDLFNNNRSKAQQAAVQIYNEQMQMKAKGKGATGVPVPPGPVMPPTQGATGGPSKPLLPNDIARQADAIKNQQGVAKPAPLMVSSLTTDVSAKGMREVLEKAEDLMKAGKFTTAIDEYNTAEQIASGQPIVPLVWIGRGNAELGAGYYARAENQLKKAFGTDPSLLMAKYDLRAFIGEKRLEAVVNDLKEIASKDQKSATPRFLLAYISYNTGNERRAAAFLDLADKCSGGVDPIYKVIREHWTLDAPESGKPDAPSNK